jgi:hypothetical protein
MKPPATTLPKFSWIYKLNKDVTAVLFLAALFLALFFPFIFENKTFFFRDMLHFGYPFKQFIWKSWQEGALPFWNPQILGGIPFLSLYHSGVLYPPGLLFLMQDMVTAFNSYYLFHHLLLTFAVYRLARFWSLSPIASIGSAVTALMGGYFLSLASIYNHFQAAVWFPMILLSFNRFLLKYKMQDFIATVIFLAIMFLAGSLETCVFTVGILWSYATLVVPRKSRNFLSRTAMLTGAVLLSLGFSAVQLVPTTALMKESMRSNGITFAENSNLSMSPAALSGAVLPEDQFGFMDRKKMPKPYFLQSCFMGLVPLGLLLAGLYSRIQCRMFWFWGILFFVGIFFSMGQYNPLYSWFYDWIPLLKLFRFPEKFYFLSAFSLVFLVGLGVNALGSESPKNRIYPAPSLFAVLTLVVLLGWVAAVQPDREWITGLITLIILAILLAIATTASKGKPALQILVVLLLVLELLARNSSILPMTDKSFYKNNPELLAKVETPKKLFRVYSGKLLEEEDIPTSNQFPVRKTLIASHLALKELLRPNLGMIYDLNYADGLTGLDLKYGWFWTNIFIQSPPEKRIRILQRSNVRTWIKDTYKSGGESLEHFDSALPRAYLVNRGRQEKSPHLLNIYYNAAFDPLKEVLLDEKFSWVRNEEFSGQIKSIEYSPNRVRIETDQNTEGMLVLLDTYFPGWKVKVDGFPERIYRANYFYRGVKLSAGRHVVEFSYLPEGFQTGLRISFLTLIFIVAGPIFYRFRNC